MDLLRRVQRLYNTGVLKRRLESGTVFGNIVVDTRTQPGYARVNSSCGKFQTCGTATSAGQGVRMSTSYILLSCTPTFMLYISIRVQFLIRTQLLINSHLLS